MGGGKLPLYTYHCGTCGKQREVIHSMNETELPACCGKLMYRSYQVDLPNIGNRDYRKPIISDSLAINPEQIPKHRKMFPDIQVTPEGQPVFDNFSQHEKYLKDTGFVKTPQRRRKRFTSKIGGKGNSKKKKAKAKIKG